ncbi:DUF2927 domain-containing protein [Pseudoruegeria sp. SK021]|uniref:DUF2927 domain-containing protein n=1 Tax=Pseudoruegeria sp. SK021 TaxID=1933035 RepID=UPI000A249F8A|nr:DUF2927 domain-containing protein [Pseudoruegeria sp. SK021]OSP55450.1 hypothetical protein BV911_07325 [Pseudoruegeria sp. SK021]
MTARLGPFGALAVALVVTACSPAPTRPTAPKPSQTATVAMPAMKQFGAPNPTPPDRSNTEIGRDFIDLSLQLENGRDLPIFTRFEQPITIGLTGKLTPIFRQELDRLIGRLRREAGVNIRRTDTPATASITVEAISQAQLQRVVPTAACFVLPQRISWDEFTRNTRRRDLNWTELKVRNAATVFIPADVSPQEIRDCLHEEIAQALGPVNDLYRLDDSIFNDDNMRSVLTGFDMMILRATYDPALRNGMTRQEVAAVLPPLLARINPRGERIATRPYRPSPRDWVDAIEHALSNGRRDPARRRAAYKALDIARTEGWQDTRLGLSLLTVGRLAEADDGSLGLDAFFEAADVYGQSPDTAIQAANVAIQIAAFALVAGEMDAAIRIANTNIPIAKKAENAALMSDFLMVKASALDAKGLTAQARSVWLDSYGWGRYGLRSDEVILGRAAEIAALVPTPQEGT